MEYKGNAVIVEDGERERRVGGGWVRASSEWMEDGGWRMEDGKGDEERTRNEGFAAAVESADVHVRAVSVFVTDSSAARPSSFTSLRPSVLNLSLPNPASLLIRSMTFTPQVPMHRLTLLFPASAPLV